MITRGNIYSLIVGVVLGIIFTMKFTPDCNGTTIESDTKTDTVVQVETKKDSVSTVPPKGTPAKVYVHNGKVKKVDGTFTVPKDSIGNLVGEVIPVELVQDTVKLDNGTIEYDAYVQGKLHKIDFTLTTVDTTIIKTITNTRTIVKSGWFAGVSTVITPDLTLREATGWLEYVHKNSWSAGGGLNYNNLMPVGEKLGLAVKFGVNIK